MKIFQPEINTANNSILVNEKSHIFKGKILEDLMGPATKKTNDLTVASNLEPGEVIKCAIVVKIVKKESPRPITNQYGETFVTSCIAKDVKNQPMQISFWMNHCTCTHAGVLSSTSGTQP